MMAGMDANPQTLFLAFVVNLLVIAAMTALLSVFPVEPAGLAVLVVASSSTIICQAIWNALV